MRATVLGLALALTAATGAHAQPTDDVERAKVLYLAAQTALDEARYEDALRDFGAVYDLTRDPVLLFKLGRAYEGAGKCETAIVYYQRYLKEGQPDPEHVALTDERIAACTPAPTVPPPSPPEPPAPVDPVPAEPSSEVPAPATRPPLSGRYAGPWLMVGGAIAALTVGAVLAYSAEAVESDVDDLYVGAGGLPPAYDGDTAQQLADLRDEGRRYEVLSWVSFGVGAGLVGGAALWYMLTKDETPPVIIAPTPTGAAATLRF